MLMGWASDEEYVRYFVPRIGYRATADALRADSSPAEGETE